MNENEIVEKDLSYLVMQAAFEVYNQLGPGFPEAIYEHELPARGLEIERRKRIVVYCKGIPLAGFVLDLVVNKRIILELNAVVEITRIHEQQALSNLKATGLPLAIIIYFGAGRVQSSRVVNTKGKAEIPPGPPKSRKLPDY